MTDYNEVLDECQRLADYWMNEQSRYDVEITPTDEEYRLVLTDRKTKRDTVDWFFSLGEIERQMENSYF